MLTCIHAIALLVATRLPLSSLLRLSDNAPRIVPFDGSMALAASSSLLASLIVHILSTIALRTPDYALTSNHKGLRRLDFMKFSLNLLLLSLSPYLPHTSSFTRQTSFSLSFMFLDRLLAQLAFDHHVLTHPNHHSTFKIIAHTHNKDLHSKFTKNIALKS